nr:class I SAM-dependent methyltransferase [uncultured Rhodoferax sp.]
MMSLLRQWLGKHPRLRSGLRRLRSFIPGRHSVSTDFVQLSSADLVSETGRLRSSWQADELPARQRVLVDRQLAHYRAGQSVDVFDVLVEAIKKLPRLNGMDTLLEIGCSSGYYSEVFGIAGLPITYAGCDYSPAFVELARKTYPDLQFDVRDATALDYADGRFDVVISGCCLLHIPEYETAIAETARVARHYAIFHRTPVLPQQSTMHFRKLAYGVETVEIHFGEAEFLALLDKHGLTLMDVQTLDEDVHQGAMTAVRTYVCSKTKS